MDTQLRVVLPIIASYVLPVQRLCFFLPASTKDCDTSIFLSAFAIASHNHERSSAFTYPDDFSRCYLPSRYRSRFAYPNDPPFETSPCKDYPGIPYPQTTELHQLFVAQLMSVRPETASRVYVDWLSSPRCRWIRRGPPAGMSPWELRWDPSHFSFLLCSASVFPWCLRKAARENSRGTIVVWSTWNNDDFFAHAHSTANLIFHAKAGTHHSEFWAFVSDDFGSCHRSPPPIQLHLPPEAASFTPAESTFVPDAWTAALAWHPDRFFAARVVMGITHGRDLGFTGDRLLRRDLRNNNSYDTHKETLEMIYESERARHWRAGPFHAPPMFNFRANPQGGISKKFSSKIRNVDDLSAPYDESKSSVNDGIDGGGITHTRIDDFIRGIQILGKHTLLCKADVCSAYKTVGVKPQDWHLIGSQTARGYDFFLQSYLSEDHQQVISGTTTASRWSSPHASLRNQTCSADMWMTLGHSLAQYMDAQIGRARAPSCCHSCKFATHWEYRWTNLRWTREWSFWALSWTLKK